MQTNSPTHTIGDTIQVQRYLEALQHSDGVTLYLDDDDHESCPARLLTARPGETLCLELGGDSRAFETYSCADGTAFRLVGEVEGAMVQTSAMALCEQQCDTDSGQRLCTYPETLEVAYRRDAFRAELTRTMYVPVDLVIPHRGKAVHGVLRNLSLGGCLVEVAMSDGVLLLEQQETLALTVHFPNGQELEAQGCIRHVGPDSGRHAALVRCQFVSISNALQRRLWYVAMEIERQHACERNRHVPAKPSRVFQAALEPSPLFQTTPEFMKRHGAGVKRRAAGAGPLGQVVSRIVTALEAQLLQLLGGGTVAVNPLLEQSHALIRQLGEGRDPLLYDIARRSGHHVLVQHGLAVAARLACLSISHDIETRRLPAVVACALFHDFGKAMLPAGIRQSGEPLDRTQRQTLSTHVQLLIDRLEGRELLSDDIVRSVVAQGNERLDGSGYPEALTRDELPPLARMMAVVDVADAMRRDRADRPALAQNEVHRHLLLAGDQLDRQWTRRYIGSFGLAPVGTLAKYSGGKLGWVQRLNENAEPAQVEIVMDLSKVRKHLERARVAYHDDIARLGSFEGAVDPREYGLELS